MPAPFRWSILFDELRFAASPFQSSLRLPLASSNFYLCFLVVIIAKTPSLLLYIMHEIDSFSPMYFLFFPVSCVRTSTDCVEAHVVHSSGRAPFITEGAQILAGESVSSSVQHIVVYKQWAIVLKVDLLSTNGIGPITCAVKIPRNRSNKLPSADDPFETSAVPHHSPRKTLLE